MVKVLVADNNGFVRDQIEANLRKIGISDFVSAVDGVDALKEFERSKPELVVMDIAISRMDGLEVTRKIKEKSKHAKIILISIAGEDYSKEAKEAGADLFVQHPFEKQSLAEATRKLVD